MKSTVECLYRSYGKHWNAIQFAILAGIFCYYFAENFILSESWEVLTLRSIDDFAMNDSIRQMQKTILAGDWTRVFTFFDYGYGNAFWLINAILFMPLYAIGDAQLQIVAGRQISLLYVFGSIYLVGLIIDRLRPDAQQLKYPILIAIATMPMVAIISTKLHVNAQSLFFGILSFYLLVREPEITRKHVIWSGVFGGIAVGLKLTGVFIIPLLGLTLISRLFDKDNGDLLKDIALFCIIFIVTASACIAPTLLLFPFFTSELKATYDIFLQFKNMGSSDAFSLKTLIIDGMAFYLSPIAFFSSVIFFFPLILDDLKKRSFVSTLIFFSLAIAEIVLLLIINKEPSYLATYILSLSFFLPLGLLGVWILPAGVPLKIVAVYVIVISSLLFGMDYRHKILSMFYYSDMVKSTKVDRQLHALNEMRNLVAPLKNPIRILQDYTSLFPATRFTDGVTVIYSYGNLKEYSADSWGKFDYISLNSKEYFVKTCPSSDASRNLSSKEIMNNSREDAIRQSLYDTGDFYSFKYRLIYEGYDTLLYKLDTN